MNAGQISLVFGVSMQIDLDFVWVIQGYLVSVWGIELDLIPVLDVMVLVVVWAVENDFISVRWIGFDLVFV